MRPPWMALELALEAPHRQPPPLPWKAPHRHPPPLPPAVEVSIHFAPQSVKGDRGKGPHPLPSLPSPSQLPLQHLKCKCTP